MKNKICYKCEKEINMAREVAAEMDYRYYHIRCLGVEKPVEVEPKWFISVQDIHGLEKVRYCIKAKDLEDIMKRLEKGIYGC